MFDPENPPPQQPLASTSAGQTGSLPPERVMRIAPLDLRQPHFRTGMRGFDRTEVVAFLTEAADDYEHALREIDRLRQDLGRMELVLNDHRERETNLRNTLLTAQRLADEVKVSAQNEAKLIVRDAEGRADAIVQKAQLRRDELERDITELRLRRRTVEGTLESSIQTLYQALEFIRDQDKPEERVLLHRPRPTEASVQPRPGAEVARAAEGPDRSVQR
jgi:cell division initiation protein